MKPEDIEEDFKKKVCSEIRIESEGTNRFRVFTPFVFDDGDCLSIVLKEQHGKWIFSDEGHTYMHLSYGLEEKDLNRGTRQKIIASALDNFSVQDRQGELILEVAEFGFGNALFDFAQALVKISDVTYLSRERVKSTFLEDFKALLTEVVPEARRTFNWHDEMRDPPAKYNVDCRINGMQKPLFVYALNSDDKVRDTTISLLQFESWQIPFSAVGVFENQEEIGRSVLARFSDVCDRQFSHLMGSKKRIQEYLIEHMNAA